MTSGIYRLQFPSGRFYIGKSVDIERRWKEHADKLEKGTAAKNMQAEYARCGMPDGQILYKCHPDHIDLMEGFFIRVNDCADMLNSASVASPSDEEVDVMMELYINNKRALELSTYEHCMSIKNLDNERSELAKQVRDITSGTALELAKIEISELEGTLHYMSQDLVAAKTEINRLKKRNIFQRILNT